MSASVPEPIAPAPAPKTARPRKVRGRREFTVDGRRWVFELEAQGLVVRRWHGRRSRRRLLTFRDLLDLTNTQRILAL
jgi:hypothetical protein